MKTVETLEDYLARLSDDTLIEVQSELLSGVVTKKGPAHTLRRQINKLIDQGNLKINMYTYRKIYLLSLSKAVDRELARRYVQFVVNGVQLEFERTR